MSSEGGGNKKLKRKEKNIANKALVVEQGNVEQVSLPNCIKHLNQWSGTTWLSEYSENNYLDISEASVI